jgi:hypothetical protein
MASSSVVSELISHFAGYLRLPPGDNYTVKILYDGGAEAGVGHDSDNPTAHPARLADTNPLHGAHLNVPIMPVLPAPQLMHAPLHKFHDPDFIISTRHSYCRTLSRRSARAVVAAAGAAGAAIISTLPSVTAAVATTS